MAVLTVYYCDMTISLQYELKATFSTQMNFYFTCLDVYLSTQVFFKTIIILLNTNIHHH